MVNENQAHCPFVILSFFIENRIVQDQPAEVYIEKIHPNPITNMQIAQLPSDEELRLEDLFSYNILDTDSEKEFDELVELAASICNCPVSMVTFIDEKRQWFKAKIGVEYAETSRDLSFCAHTILDDDVMVVEDSLLDDRFKDNPFTQLEKPVRFYAGAPIVSPEGYKLGTLCVINHTPKKLSHVQERALVILSHQITRLLELRKKSASLRKRAEQIIELKEQSVNQVLQDHELQKQQIAEEIQEQIAQQVAACRLYIGIAGESEAMRNEYLKKVNEKLATVITDMRKLSRLLTPAVLPNVPLEDIVSDYIKNIQEDMPFKLRVSSKGNSLFTSMDINLTLFRVIEIWINNLKNRTDVTNVQVLFTYNGSVQLNIENDSTSYGMEEVEMDVMRSAIDARINHLQGSISILPNPTGGTALHIHLPYEA